MKDLEEFIAFKAPFFISTVMVIALLFWTVQIAFAVSASPTAHTLEQADGTRFQARMWGDEWLHGWETVEGYTILPDETTGSWNYAVLDKDQALVPSRQVVGNGPPPSNTPKHIRPRRGNARAKVLGPRAPKVPDGPSKVVPSTGTANIPVILINFANTTTTYTNTDFDTLLFGSTGNSSMKDYYEEVSYGNFSVSAGPSGVVGWYTAANGHDYYGQNDASGDDQWPGDLVYEAVVAADASVNFSAYDADGDCYVDVVDLVHQGTGEEAGFHISTDIWSHRWSLSAAQSWGNSNYGIYTTNDPCPGGGFIKVNDYVIQPEIYGGSQHTIGVFAHEYGHALGLPDLYDTDGSSYGIGDWGLMGGGSWNGITRNGDSPAHFSAWSKLFLGWVSPTHVNTSLSGESISQVETNDDVYQLLSNPGGASDWTSGGAGSGEYFLVENRRKIGFDAGLDGEGLLIWHVDESKGNNRDETNYLVALEQADGLFNLENDVNQGDANDPWKSNTTGFTESTTPNSNLYNGSSSGVRVTDISASAVTMTANLIINWPPPTITSGPTASSITTSSAIITWSTDESSDSVVEYGPTTSYGTSKSDTTDVTSHSITLTGLSPSTTYHYRVKSTDSSGNGPTVSGDNTFTTGGTTRTVCSSGCDYTSIQTAVNAANSGDTIEVQAGTYTENVDITKSVNLIGAGASVTTVNAASSSDHVFEVTADSVNISGFTVTGATGVAKAGIHLYTSSYSKIENVNASNNYYGIRLPSSLYNTIANNTASNNEGGIGLDFSSNYNTITNNTANSNDVWGIGLVNVSSNLIYNNLFNNTNNHYFSGTIYTNDWNTTKTAGTNIVGGSYFGGNFWAKPDGTGFSETCTDSNSEGICDSSYTLASGNVDYLPLAISVGDTTLPSITIASPTNTTYTGTSISLAVSADETIAIWMYSLNGVANVTFTPNTTITATEGSNNIIVYATDSAGNTGASTRVYFTVSTGEYCSVSTTYSSSDYIVRVSLNGEEKTSSSSKYSDFTSPTLTTLEKGSTYTLEVKGYSWSISNESVKAWIDFNNDKDFSDSGEEIDLGSSMFSGTYTFNKSFTVPLNAETSETRMRIYMQFSTAPSPCENATFGEVEDYTVSLTVTDSTPPSITIASPTNTTYSSTSISLAVSADETIAIWMYSLNGAANVTFTPNTTITTAEGSNNIIVYANDTSGNIGSSTRVYFTVAANAPSVIHQYHWYADYDSSGTITRADGLVIGVIVNDTDGLSDITSVTVDATALGMSSTLTLNKNPGSAWSDAHYMEALDLAALNVVATSGTASLTVTVTDSTGLTGTGTLSVTINEDIVPEIIHSVAWSDASGNTLFVAYPWDIGTSHISTVKLDASAVGLWDDLPMNYDASWGGYALWTPITAGTFSSTAAGSYSLNIDATDTSGYSGTGTVVFVKS